MFEISGGSVESATIRVSFWQAVKAGAGFVLGAIAMVTLLWPVYVVVYLLFLAGVLRTMSTR